MPRSRPQGGTSGYERIVQAEEAEEEGPYNYDHDEGPFQDPLRLSTSDDTHFSPIQPKRRERMHIPSGSNSPRRSGRRRRTNSGVDIKAINARLERWADEIKDKFTIRKVRGKSAQDEHLEIYQSVFQAPEGVRPATKELLEADHAEPGERLSKLEFHDMVESVRTAIELGLHPTLIAQGSSGSYFARNSSGKVLGVFKPKDEEPYASKNPKWTKWIHRNLFPFGFGRACLIPNLSYVSEAAAYVLDCQLRTNLVPYTEVVSLSSKSFFYDYWDRRQHYRKGKPLPEKQGSFQVFLKGYKGATEFFQEHPWPDHHNGGFRDAPKRTKRRRWAEDCRPASAVGDVSDAEDDGPTGAQSRARLEFWTDALRESFREQLEKLVILDYIMRNTDRGTDNWMIKVDEQKQTAEVVLEPPKDDSMLNGNADPYYRRQESMSTTPGGDGRTAVPNIGAIDNSLSWPWKHPDAWRSYPFGWLFLPVSLIGRPFSAKTRAHFLPLLTSKDWWSDTQVKLRQCFEIDADFKERMFARQIAVMKGQAWNVVETLKTPDHGPLELTRRDRACVWDDLVEVPVAVHMSRPSEEMRRSAHRLRAEQAREIRQVRSSSEQGEMDISAAMGSAPQPNHDLLGFNSSPVREFAQNPFNYSRHNSSDIVPQSKDSTEPLSTTAPITFDLPPTPSRKRPTTTRAHTGDNRTSQEASRRHWQPQSERRRRFSLGRRSSGLSEGSDGDGDLGFVAAREQEGSRRKVIVERLEMIKGKPPVFSWC
nr:hypothetical protein B0A51_07972 [Rachicladosporium sp. CCFEE 5018]